MNAVPIGNLELQARDQRNQLHKTADALRGKIEASREKLSLPSQAREHFAGASILVSIIGFGLGYSFAGMFTRR